MAVKSSQKEEVKDFLLLALLFFTKRLLVYKPNYIDFAYS